MNLVAFSGTLSPRRHLLLGHSHRGNLRQREEVRAGFQAQKNMTEMYDSYQQEFTDLTHTISKNTSQIGNMLGQQQNDLIASTSDLFSDARAQLPMMDMEARAAQSKLRSQLVARTKQFDSDLQKLQVDFNRSKGSSAQGSKEELFYGRSQPDMVSTLLPATRPHSLVAHAFFHSIAGSTSQTAMTRGNGCWRLKTGLQTAAGASKRAGALLQKQKKSARTSSVICTTRGKPFSTRETTSDKRLTI